MNAHIKYTKKLTGRLNPPSSKNYTTRYLLVAALAEGESRIHYPAKSADSDALIRCLVALGARIWRFNVNASNAAQFLAYNGAQQEIVTLNGTMNLSTHTWHHVAVTREGDTFVWLVSVEIPKIREL